MSYHFDGLLFNLMSLQTNSKVRYTQKPNLVKGLRKYSMESWTHESAYKEVGEKRLKETVKQSLKTFNIPLNSWEIALLGVVLPKNGSKAYEMEKTAEAERKRAT